ncbi:MAG TPA: hypothetical protein VNA57_08935 [Acidimicrobiales bacterium]|nr:hypothetical protein [Acidimicrobiales bacterium]
MARNTEENDITAQERGYTTADTPVGVPVELLEGQPGAASRLLDEQRDASQALTTVDSRWVPSRGVLVTDLKGQSTSKR